MGYEKVIKMNVYGNGVSAGNLARMLFLAYAGVAVMQIVQSALGIKGEEGLSWYAQWLREGTLALPVVAGAALLSGRRASHGPHHQTNFSFVALYAAAMGAISILRAVFPANASAGGHMMSGVQASASTPAMLQHTLLVLVVAGAFAVVGDMMLYSLTTSYSGGLVRLSSRWRVAGVVGLPVVLMSVTPLFDANSIPLAQTSFPDQTIHPRVSLLLVAKQLEDGSLAYVAPNYGANGVRPIIEMTEGETLDITLKNELPFEVSLHVHGVLYNLGSDGTRRSGTIVKPGEQRTYQWRAGKGTAGYWHYHDHVVGDDEGTGGIRGGLYGGLVIRRPGDPEPTKTFVLVMHDATFNGRQYPNTPQPTARQGELVEFLIITHGDSVHTFHLHGHRWLTPPRVASPSADLPANEGSGREDNRIMAPGDSFGFLTRAGDEVGPGMWMYHCHFQSHASFMMGYFNVLPAATKGR